MTRWEDRAACAGLDPRTMDAIFYPYADAGPDAYGAARTFCDRCPVRVECLEAALVEESQPGAMAFGMRGGLRPKERDRERNRRGMVRPAGPVPKCGTEQGAAKHRRAGEELCAACGWAVSRGEAW